MRRDERWQVLVTYADRGEGHEGRIYRATNWTFAGETAPERRWTSAGGEMVARKATHSRTYSEMRGLGHVLGEPSTKYRFVKRVW